MFNVSEFKGYLARTGTLPTNRFYVEIPVPRVLFNAEVTVSGVRRNLSTFTQDLQFRAESVRAPGVAINVTNVNRYGVGPLQKFPYNAQFTDTSISFIADKDSLVWAFFYNWLNNVFNFSNNYNPGTDYLRYRSNYMEDYVVPIRINVYDYDGVPSNSIVLVDAYPISMNDIPLSWGDNNQLKRITVTFVYHHWVMTNVNMEDNSMKAPDPPGYVIPKVGTIAAPKPKPADPVKPRPIAPDPRQNMRNENGLYNNPTVPGGTQTPTFE